MICYGVANAIAALTTGSVVKVTGRLPVMTFAFFLHLAIMVALLFWRPTPEQGSIFFVMSGLWGVCDAIWLVQVNGEFQLDSSYNFVASVNLLSRVKAGLMNVRRVKSWRSQYVFGCLKVSPPRQLRGFPSSPLRYCGCRYMHG